MRLNQDKVVIEARAFGSGQVVINGHRIEKWEGRLSKALFFFLLDQRMVTRDDIFGAFWPDLTAKQATDVFHVVKGKLSRLLGANLVVFSNGFYHISNEFDLFYDVAKFQELTLLAAGTTDQETAGYYESALDLYQGDFLEGMAADWIVYRRRQLLEAYADVMVKLGHSWEGSANPQATLELYLRAYGIVPLREDLIRGLMRVYSQMGSQPLALGTYNDLVENLKNTLNVAPDPLTISLANKIKASP